MYTKATPSEIHTHVEDLLLAFHRGIRILWIILLSIAI